MKYTKPATALLLAAIATFTLGQTTTAPSVKGKFTISKETTLVDGPLNADGTINYVAAINELLGKGVKDEDNAAILLLEVYGGGKPDSLELKELAALNTAPPTATANRMEYFLSYLARTTGKDQNQLFDEKYSRQEIWLREHPWKKEEYPLVADWLAASDGALKVAIDASQRPRLFVPFLTDKTPPNALDGLPYLPGNPTVSQMLATRAMLEAGTNRQAALADLKAGRMLARLVANEHVALENLSALQMENYILRAYAGLATAGNADAAFLQTIRGEINAQPPLPDRDPTREHVEEMIALDVIMQCIRGDSERIMRLVSFNFDETTHVDIGDWAHADWNAALREVIRIFEEDDGLPEKPAAEKIKNLNEKAAMAKADGVPPFIPLEGDILKSGVPVVEKYLKKRDGETMESFTRRITRWIAGASPPDELRGISLQQRSLVTRKLSLLAVTLEEYRLAHSAYPENLAVLGNIDVADPFSGKDLLYRRGGDGFLIWSVGFNGKDGGGDDYSSDDIAIRSAQYAK